MLTRGTKFLTIVVKGKYFAVPSAPVIAIPIDDAKRLSLRYRQEEEPVRNSKYVLPSRPKWNSVVLLPMLYPGLINVFLILPFCLTLPTPTRPNVLTFVISAPRDGTNVVTRAFRVIRHLLVSVVRRNTFYQVRTTNGRGILPGRGSVLVARVVRSVILVSASTPSARRVRICANNVRGHPFVVLKDSTQRRIVQESMVNSFNGGQAPIRLCVRDVPILVQLVRRLRETCTRPFNFEIRRFPTYGSVHARAMGRELPRSVAPPRLQLIGSRVGNRPVNTSLRVHLPLTGRSSNDLIYCHSRRSIRVLVNVRLRVSNGRNPTYASFLLLSGRVISSRVTPDPSVRQAPSTKNGRA